MHLLESLPRAFVTIFSKLADYSVKYNEMACPNHLQNITIFCSSKKLFVLNRIKFEKNEA